MNIEQALNDLPKLEQSEISDLVNSDLVDHLYKGALPASIIAFFASVAIFTFLYKPSNHILLILWLGVFDLTLIGIVILDRLYNKFKSKYSPQRWNIALSLLITNCTVLWGLTVYFFPDVLLERFLLCAMLFMVAASFSTATIGTFVLCAICVFFVLSPVAIMFLLNNGIYYKISGIFVLIYSFFLLGMNKKSTAWLIYSLKLSRILVSVSHSATHNLLTDLKNQKALGEEIERFIENASKFKCVFALVCLSINRLERFNTSLGYQVGDLIIQTVAKRLESRIAKFDAKGGKIKRELTQPRPDAFVILISPVDKTELKREVKDYLRVLEMPFHLGQREATLTASIGVSIYPEDGDNTKTLLSNVYAAMFQAKNMGGNQIEYYKREINEKTPSMLDLESDLHHALERKEFLVFYQPIIELATQQIVGMEALIRWNHPKRGIVFPDDFIALAEETRLIIPIGKWVLEEACRQTKQWHLQGFSHLKLKVSVNLSPKQLHQDDFIDIIDNALKISKLDAQFLDLELTETEMLNENLISLIKDIKKRGITLSIDDFGTGYSGLSYLKFFDVDKIKIDKSFIHDIPKNDDSVTIVSAILAMAKELNISTLAEGVETYEQLKFLKEKDCNYIQGYYFSKPLFSDVFEQYLKDHVTGVSVDAIEYTKSQSKE